MSGRTVGGVLGLLISIYLFFAGLQRFENDGFGALAVPLILILLSVGYLAQSRRKK